MPAPEFLKIFKTVKRKTNNLESCASKSVLHYILNSKTIEGSLLPWIKVFGGMLDI